MDQKPSYEQVPYQSQSAYPHPVPPPSYDAASSQQAPMGLYPTVPQYPPHDTNYVQPPPTTTTTIVQSKCPLKSNPLPMSHHPTMHFLFNFSLFKQQTAVYHPPVGPEPTSMTCPSCRQSIITSLDYETTTRTHIGAGICCIFG